MTVQKQAQPLKDANDSFVDINRIIQIQNPKNCHKETEWNPVQVEVSDCDQSAQDLSKFKPYCGELKDLSYVGLGQNFGPNEFNMSYQEYRNSIHSNPSVVRDSFKNGLGGSGIGCSEIGHLDMGIFQSPQKELDIIDEQYDSDLKNVGEAS